MDRRKSQMWNHFTSKSSTVVQCNICKDELAFAGGTGSMKNHMRAKHPSVILTAETSASSVSKMTAEVGKLEELALQRKERLKALREKQMDMADGKPSVKSDEEQQSLPKPLFRSYQPLDDSLKEHQLPKIKPVEVIEKVKDQLEAAKPEPLVEEVDLMNLAPCKPDWDLKRDIAKKLDKLERRTQRAIAEIIRERILAENDLAAVASWVASEDTSRSSIIGPKLPTNYGRSAITPAITDSSEKRARTGEVGFDDDSD